jgi:hypothetical protein
MYFDRQEADTYLRPLLKRCHSKSKKAFWQWLRLTLAKTVATAEYLEYMQEHRCPLEVVSTAAGFTYTVNGGTALIAVGDEKCPAVWKLPVDKLEWALSMYPVTLKALPPLESPEMLEWQKTRQLIKKMEWLTPSQKKEWRKQIDALKPEPDPNPVPRYRLVKTINGQEIPLHRIFLIDQGADLLTLSGSFLTIEAVDGDFLNYGLASVRVTVEALVADGYRGANRASHGSTVVELPNLQILYDPEAQATFEDSHLQVKVVRGDIETTLPIQPNSKWRASCFGEIVEAGAFEPLAADERLADGQGAIDRPQMKINPAQPSS